LLFPADAQAKLLFRHAGAIAAEQMVAMLVQVMAVNVMQEVAEQQRGGNAGHAPQPRAGGQGNNR
jgi:hypothetical protein